VLAGGLVANGIARWNGSAWSALGSGVSGNLPTVYALTAFDDGTGPALCAGGSFFNAGGVHGPYVAKWDGAAWAALANGMSGDVHALAVFDSGSGPTLHAGGFTYEGN